MNKKAEYGGNAMFQNNKKAAFLDYLMIIVGTALMATAINSVFDMSGMVTGGFSGIAIVQDLDVRNRIITVFKTKCNDILSTVVYT